MDQATKQTVIHWQKEQASCFFMVSLCREYGETGDVIFWQEQARRAHVFAVSSANHSKLYKKD